jgi:tight adherence protein C
MNQYQFQWTLVIIISLVVAWVVYFISSRVRVERSAASRVKRMVSDKSLSVFDRGGEKIAKRMGVSMESWQILLEWAQLGGHFQNWSVGGVFARSSVLAMMGLIYIVLFKAPPIAWLLVPLALFIPFMQLRGRANDVKKQVKRLLPETATVIAAEMDAGSTAAQAIGRTAELPGALGVILSDAVAQATQSARSMFSHGSNPGILMEILSKWELPELSRFAMQLNRVAEKGVDAPRIMTDIARGLAREYRSHVQQTAANMDTELLAPMTLFFFLPFVVVILAPVIISFIGMF